MGLERLYLVSPRVFPHADATARSSGADDILANVVQCDTLVDALSDCTLVFASSARERSLSWPQLSPRRCANKIVSLDSDAQVALVFGRERSGLSNAELDVCHVLVCIPSHSEFSSLNLAAAVQVLCYELFVAATSNPLTGSRDDEPIAKVQLVEQFYTHLQETLIELEFLDPCNPKHLMRRLRRLFNRVGLTVKEVNILRGILTAIKRKI